MPMNVPASQPMSQRGKFSWQHEQYFHHHNIKAAAIPNHFRMQLSCD